MSISVTPKQERLIQTRLQEGKYSSAEEVLDVALRLLTEFEHTDAEWTQSVRSKINAAIEASKHTLPVDGETFV